MKIEKKSLKREDLFQFALKKLNHSSFENCKVIETHLFRLKVNEDYVINSLRDVEELVTFLNHHE